MMSFFFRSKNASQNVAFTRRYLEQYEAKVVIIRNNADRKRLLERLDSICSPV